MYSPGAARISSVARLLSSLAGRRRATVRPAAPSVAFRAAPRRVYALTSTVQVACETLGRLRRLLKPLGGLQRLCHALLSPPTVPSSPHRRPWARRNRRVGQQLTRSPRPPTPTIPAHLSTVGLRTRTITSAVNSLRQSRQLTALRPSPPPGQGASLRRRRLHQAARTREAAQLRTARPSRSRPLGPRLRTRRPSLNT